jgi:MFS family permease
MNTKAKTQSPMSRIFAISDFRLLWIGSATSILGDQFAFIATPWLVLQITNDPLVLGTVLALEGIPRAIFILIGGAITDRFSPRTIMLTADIIRMILTTLMAVVIFIGAIKLWMLYAFGLAFGLVAGFAIPASNSMVPMLIPEEDLQAGNSVSMGTAQLISFIGPTIAGIIIAGYAKSPTGSALAFTIDAISFAVSAFTLWLIRGARKHAQHAETESIWASIGAGLHYLWNESNLRFMFTTMALTNFLMIGPLLVGIPVLAAQRLPEGAVAFGLLISAYAGGNLAGYLLSGALPRPTGNMLMILLIVLIAAFGGVMIVIGLISNTWLDFTLMLLLGIGNGYIGLILITWIQQRTPKEMLGRMMSLLMLSNLGLTPISQTVAGLVSKWTLTGLFLATGGLIVLVDLWMITQPALQTITHSVVAASNSPAASEAESN